MSTQNAGAEAKDAVNLDELDKCMHDLDMEIKNELLEAKMVNEDGIRPLPLSPDRWWHADMQALANELSPGVLKEMKKRILNSNIQKEKLALDESTKRMRDFFGREIARYTKRLNSLNAKKQVVSSLEEAIQRSQEENVRLNEVIDKQVTLLKKIAKKYMAVKSSRGER